MKFDVISFDLQGTLSDSAFSDEFWIETLPKLFAKSKKIPVDDAKKELAKRFKDYGKYDYRYYSMKYWLDELKLNLSFIDVLKRIKNKPCFFEDTKQLLNELNGKAKIIIASSTTKDFIDAELGKNKNFFNAVYSSLEDFSIPGKPQEFYELLAKKLNVPKHKVLHIGDSREMDIDNAKKAGLSTFYFDKTISREKLIKDLKCLIFL